MSKTLKELRAREHELKVEGRAILDAAGAADRDLTAAEEDRLTAIETEIAKISADVVKAEKAADRRRNLDAGGQAMPVNDPARIEVGADRAASDPRAGFASLAEFATAVRRSNPLVAGGTMDERLLRATPTGYHREGGSNDGYHVPPEFRDRIWELVFEQDNLITEIDAETTSSNQVNDLQDETTPWGATGVRAFWRSEAGQMSPTREGVKPRSCVLNELYAFVTATDELLEDAPRLNSRLGIKAAEAINWKLDSAIISGNGVGQPLGYRNSNAIVSVAKETGQAADTIVAANVAKMYSRLLPSSLARSHWRINSDAMPQIMTMVLGDKPIWTPPATGFAGAPGGFLLGRPIRMSEHSETVGDKGDIELIDPKGYYGLRKAGGVKFASSIHLYFDYGLQAFRWTIRFGGQPHLTAPISPAKGTATKSHFVTLDARA